MSNDESDDESSETEFNAEWEMVETAGAKIQQFRQKIVGGWLVLCAMDGTTSTVFLPDPDYAWTPPIKKSRKRSDFF